MSHNMSCSDLTESIRNVVVHFRRSRAFTPVAERIDFDLLSESDVHEIFECVVAGEEAMASLSSSPELCSNPKLESSGVAGSGKNYRFIGEMRRRLHQDQFRAILIMAELASTATREDMEEARRVDGNKIPRGKSRCVESSTKWDLLKTAFAALRLSRAEFYSCVECGSKQIGAFIAR